MTMIAEHLRRATDTLQKTSDSPRLDAEILLAHILQQDRAELLINKKTELKTTAVAELSTLIFQRAQRIPIPYLTGRQEFFGLSLEVTPDVLIPRPATELLVEAVLNRLPADITITIADIGTGSGAIALALATYLPLATIIASDISSVALAVSKSNAQRLGLADRITFLQSSLLTSYKLLPDFVIANLPYLRPDQLSEPSIQHEPRLALDGGQDGLELVHQLIDQLVTLPTLAGVALELDPQQIQVVRKRLAGVWPDREITEIGDGQMMRGLVSWQ